MSVELKKEHQIQVSVNRKLVVFVIKSATGAEIKATAIAQGVNIQQDFALFEEKDHHNPVGDDENVKLHNEQKFKAVAPDDNSLV